MLHDYDVPSFLSMEELSRDRGLDSFRTLTGKTTERAMHIAFMKATNQENHGSYFKMKFKD